jgi:hypothetical protein
MEGDTPGKTVARRRHGKRDAGRNRVPITTSLAFSEPRAARLATGRAAVRICLEDYGDDRRRTTRACSIIVRQGLEAAEVKIARRALDLLVKVDEELSARYVITSDLWADINRVVHEAAKNGNAAIAAVCRQCIADEIHPIVHFVPNGSRGRCPLETPSTAPLERAGILGGQTA